MRRTRRSRRARGWTDAHLLQLRCGHDFFREAWGDKPFSEETLLDMRQAWARHGEEVEAEHQEHYRKQPATRSWGWWMFVSPQPRDESKVEWLQLFEIGEVSKEEATAAAKRDADHQDRRTSFSQGFQPFRRCAGWWFLNGPRDESITEVAQLTKLKVLYPIEQEILRGERPSTIYDVRGKAGHAWRHLTPDERLLLGLPPIDQPITIAE